MRFRPIRPGLCSGGESSVAAETDLILGVLHIRSLFLAHSCCVLVFIVALHTICAGFKISLTQLVRFVREF